MRGELALKTKIICGLFLLVSLIFPVLSYGQSLMHEPEIKVGILSNQPNVVVSASTDFSVTDNDTNQIIGKYAPNERVVISLSGKTVTVNGKSVAAKEISITLKLDNGEYYSEVNRRHYRGRITIHQSNGKSGLTVVDTLPIEQYLYGVIAKEISPDWPGEAVKAQAVAARTYALHSLNKHQDDGYDVCASTDCQVYGGYDSEAPGAVRAVDATKGKVIYYQGKLISAFFHSSSGGYTENSENVWSMSYPYLKGVPDYDQNTPYFKWEKQVSVSELETALKGAGYNIGNLYAIELSSLSKPPVDAFDRGVSGRVKEIRFVGTSGTAFLSGNKLRSMLGLNSTLFDVDVVVPAQKALEFEITDSAGDHQTKEVALNLPPYKQKDFLTEKRAVHHITRRPLETVIFRGFGWGHGIGLSQWGAKEMAQSGPKGDVTYFEQILKHYYQGVDIQKAY